MEADDRRSYFRVPARIAVRHRLASDADVAAFERELALRGNEPPVQVDASLRVLFDRLERKLDAILSRLEPDGTPALGPADVRDAEISGSGVRYAWSEPIGVGDRVLVELLIPGEPPRTVRSIGEVVFREEPREPAACGWVAVRFDTIDEGDREAVIRYTYELQRIALRNRAVGQEAR